MSGEMLTPMGDRYDLDLGSGHYLSWYTFQGAEDRHTGAIIYHATQNNETGWCEGSVAWENAPGDPRPTWTLEGAADEHITLSPSIKCLSCGDHGHIVNGKWV